MRGPYRMVQSLRIVGRYRMDRAALTVRFDVGAYDRSRGLEIDPTVGFSVTLTGSGVQTGLAATIPALTTSAAGRRTHVDCADHAVERDRTAKHSARRVRQKYLASAQLPARPE